MKRVFCFLLIFCGSLFAQNNNQLLNGAFHLFEINKFGDGFGGVLETLIFDGVDSVEYTVISPVSNETGKLSYSVDSEGRLTLYYGEIELHGSVKPDSSMFTYVLTDSTEFSDYGIGIAIKVGDQLQASDLNPRYTGYGYIPESAIGVVSFIAGAENNSVFGYEGVPDSVFNETVTYQILNNNRVDFHIDGANIEAAFGQQGKIGLGVYTGAGRNGLYSVVRNDGNLDGTVLDKTFYIVQMLSGDYEDAAYLELTCHPNGTGEYTKQFYQNTIGSTTGVFTYTITNNELLVIEDGDTLHGAISDDLDFLTYTRGPAGTFGMGFGLAQIVLPQVNVGETSSEAETFRMLQNYPNPFNPETMIFWNQSLSGLVSVRITNIRGEVVRSLFDGNLSAGAHNQLWDGKDDFGHQLSSGIYICQVCLNQIPMQLRKMMLLK